MGPSENITFPLSGAAAGAMVLVTDAVKVTFVPTSAGFGADVRAVLVASGCTTREIVFEVLD
jgi:hypothetical protein